MSSNYQNQGVLVVQAGLGPIRASAWENSRDGVSMGTSVTLSKSFFNKKKNEFDKSSCSLALSEVSTAIQVLQDVQAQMLVRSRDISRKPDTTSQASEEPIAAAAPGEF